MGDVKPLAAGRSAARDVEARRAMDARERMILTMAEGQKGWREGEEKGST